MKFILISVLLIFTLLIYKVGDSQELILTFSDVGKSFSYKLSDNKSNDSTFIVKSLYEHLISLYSKGYLAATIDSFHSDSAQVKAYGMMGLQYKWVNIKPDSLSQRCFNDLGVRIPRNEGKIINPQRFAKLTSTIIKRLEDSGYPFARVKLDSIKISRNTVDAILILEKGPKITIDTLYLKGDARVTYNYIVALLALKKGEPYSESKILSIDKKLRQQAYLSIIKPTEVEFLTHTSRLYCYLSNKSASRFSGLAGFYKDKTDDKIKLNGDLNLSLVNTMRNGEKINFAWKAPGKGTQNLNIETDWPYTFGSQVGLLGTFSLYKHDSTYITINPKLSLSFFTPNGGRFLLNLDYKKTSYSSITEEQKSQYANTSALLYGVGYERNSLNSIVLPSYGLYFRSSLNTGNRKVSKTSSPKSNLIEGEMLVRAFIPLYENSIIFALSSNSKAKLVYNSSGSSKLYENEMYLIGGMGTIRGFNQEAVLSSAYSIASAEIHLRISEGSGFFLFADKGFVKTYELNQIKATWPIGIGIGLNLVTKAGLFNLSYAVGKGFGQSLSFGDAKVHFGIATVF